VTAGTQPPKALRQDTVSLWLLLKVASLQATLLTEEWGIPQPIPCHCLMMAVGDTPGSDFMLAPPFGSSGPH
jgi:hypothetical protein